MKSLIFALATLLPIWDEADEVRKLVETRFPKGEMEVRLWDETRVDILTPEYAIEVDWASKWAEGIGQALYYSAVTGRKAGLVLLVRDKDEFRYVYRGQTVAAKHGVKLWVVRVAE